MSPRLKPASLVLSFILTLSQFFTPFGALASSRESINVYPDTQHAFHNDTSAARYNREAAELAWARTIAFFKATLGAG